MTSVEWPCNNVGHLAYEMAAASYYNTIGLLWWKKREKYE